jgi:hypothetical protein
MVSPIFFTIDSRVARQDLPEMSETTRLPEADCETLQRLVTVRGWSEFQHFCLVGGFLSNET